MSKLQRFVGGFALGMLDGIQKREATEREIQKEKILMQLRADQEKELFTYKDLLERRKPDAKFSDSDYTTGKTTLRNSYGEEVGTIDVPASEKAKYDFEQKKQSLDLENISSQIASRARDDARQERSTNAYIGSLDRAGAATSAGSTLSGPGGTATTSDRANEIAFRQKTLVDDLVRSGVPADAVQLTIIKSLKQAAARGKPPSAAEEYFISAADILRKAYQKGGMSENNNTLKNIKSLDGSN